MANRYALRLTKVKATQAGRKLPHGKTRQGLSPVLERRVVVALCPNAGINVHQYTD